jgi:undecaprenyl-diphosphatase
VNIDSRLCLRIYNLSGKRILDQIFYTISKIGDGWIYLGLTIIYLIFETTAAVKILPAFIAAYSMEALIYFLIKKNVKRIRPFKTIDNISSLILPPDEFSFPSGHTAAAAVFSVICGVVFPLTRIYLVFYTAAVGFSRIYNGVHYPGDVFAGAALGVICAKTGLLIF